MKTDHFLLAKAVVLSLMSACACGAAPIDAVANLPLPADLGAIPRMTCPVYLTEFHIWYHAPFTQDGRPGWIHGGPSESADGQAMEPDWQRERNSVGYPLIGFYHSNDREILRWQLETIHNAGVDGVFVDRFPETKSGDHYVQDETWERLLDIAQRAGVKIGMHDEVQFRRQGPAQDPEVSARRIAACIRAYGKHPAYLRINGMPAVVFQFWDQWQKKATPESMRKMMQRTNELAGEPVWFIPMAFPTSWIYTIPEARGFLTMANSADFFQNVQGYTSALPSSAGLEKNLPFFADARKQFADKQLGLWGYAAFNNSPMKKAGSVAWLPRRGGKTLVELMRTYQKANPDFVMLSSWNDWEENTALEPGISYEGFTGDPYLYCRILAAMKGQTFTPAELPEKESVDPLMWQMLYGIDQTPPVISRERYLPLDPAVIVRVSDSGSAVAGAKMFVRGSAWIDASASELKTAEMSLTQAPNKATDGSLLSLPNSPIELRVSRECTGILSDAFFIAVEYLDSGGGRLVIDYPTRIAKLDYKPDEEQIFGINAQISLTGTQKWKSAVRLIRGADLSRETLTMRLLCRGDKLDEGVRISRVHIFTADTPVVAGQEISFAKAESQVKTYRFACPDLLGARPKAVYICATDQSGNTSAPVALMPDPAETVKNLPAE